MVDSPCDAHVVSFFNLAICCFLRPPRRGRRPDRWLDRRLRCWAELLIGLRIVTVGVVWRAGQDAAPCCERFCECSAQPCLVSWFRPLDPMDICGSLAFVFFPTGLLFCLCTAPTRLFRWNTFFPSLSVAKAARTEQENGDDTLPPDPKKANHFESRSLSRRWFPRSALVTRCGALTAWHCGSVRWLSSPFPGVFFFSAAGPIESQLLAYRLPSSTSSTAALSQTLVTSGPAHLPRPHQVLCVDRARTTLVVSKSTCWWTCETAVRPVSQGNLKHLTSKQRVQAKRFCCLHYRETSNEGQPGQLISWVCFCCCCFFVRTLLFCWAFAELE